MTGQAASQGGGGVVRALLAAGSVFELSAGMVFASMERYIDLDDLMHV